MRDWYCYQAGIASNSLGLKIAHRKGMWNAYEIFGLNENADDESIRHRYRQLCHQLHPDKSPIGPEYFLGLQEAYAILRDPIRRTREGRIRQFKLAPPAYANYSERSQLLMQNISQLGMMM